MNIAHKFGRKYITNAISLAENTSQIDIVFLEDIGFHLSGDNSSCGRGLALLGVSFFLPGS